MEWIKRWLTEFKQWLYDMLIYIPQKLFDLFLQAIAEVIKALPLPDFIANATLGDYIGSDVAYLLNLSGVSQALAIMGTAYTFYFLRRVLTLGIW